MCTHVRLHELPHMAVPVTSIDPREKAARPGMVWPGPVVSSLGAALMQCPSVYSCIEFAVPWQEARLELEATGAGGSTGPRGNGDSARVIAN